MSSGRRRQRQSGGRVGVLAARRSQAVVRQAHCRRARALAAALACLSLAWPWPVRGAADADRRAPPGVWGAVIPPGREALLGAMLGRGAVLPDGCTFAGGAIERSVARGSYRCPDGEVVLELRHPSTAPAAALRTDRMAIVTMRGAPPAAFLADVERRVREGEGAFEWSEPKGSGRRKREPDFPERYPLFGALLVGLGQTLVIVLGLWWGIIRLPRLPADRS